MKIQGHLIKCENGVLLFDIDGFTPDLETDKKYNIDIKPYKTARSLEQNRMMWGIIQQIAEDTGNELMDIYIEGLEFCDAKHIFMESVPEAENELKKAFRAVKIMEGRININDKQTVVYKCYFGSSKFNSAEMTKLISYFQDLATSLGIKIESENLCNR